MNGRFYTRENMARRIDGESSIGFPLRLNHLCDIWLNRSFYHRTKPTESLHENDDGKLIRGIAANRIA